VNAKWGDNNSHKNLCASEIV